MQPSRRHIVALIASAALLPTASFPVFANEDQAASAIKLLTKGAAVKPGRVKLSLPELAENGNTVSLTVDAESPMTAVDHVKAIHIISEKNPIARVMSFHLTPRSGRARVHTNIRLATSQVVTALAEMSDGSFWSGTQEVIVTLTACIDAG